jgi:hypothetical protein
MPGRTVSLLDREERLVAFCHLTQHARLKDAARDSLSR